MSTEQHLETLGLSPGASAADIKRAWRETLLKVHPDREGGSREAYDRLQEAYLHLTGRAPRVNAVPVRIILDFRGWSRPFLGKFWAYVALEGRFRDQPVIIDLSVELPSLWDHGRINGSWLFEPHEFGRVRELLGDGGKTINVMLTVACE